MVQGIYDSDLIYAAAGMTGKQRSLDKKSNHHLCIAYLQSLGQDISMQDTMLLDRRLNVP